MKNLFKKFAIILFSGILLSGCGLFQNTFKDEPNEVSYSGILSAQTDEDVRPGTHILVTDDKLEILLRSVAINLSNSQYLGNKVTVIGVMDDSDNVFTVSGVSVLEVLSDAAMDSEITEYKNTDQGFKVSYYSDWEVKENPDDVSFLSPSETGYFDAVSISQFPFSYTPQVSENGETDTALQAYFGERRPDITDLNDRMRKIGVDLLDAAYFETKDGGFEYYLYRNGLIYKISFLPGNDPNTLDENIRIFNEMLDSFQFLGFTVEDSSVETPDETEPADIEDISADSSDLEVPNIDMEMSFFESSPYHFRASYPTSWYYAGSLSTDPNILHHYALSDEPVEGNNELIDLDVWAGNLPSQTIQKTASSLTIYVSVEGQAYRVSGDIKYEDLITYIASSIRSIPKETEN